VRGEYDQHIARLASSSGALSLASTFVGHSLRGSDA